MWENLKVLIKVLIFMLTIVSYIGLFIAVLACTLFIYISLLKIKLI